MRIQSCEICKGRTERKKEDLHQKIIGIAMDLFKKQGFAATTMEQIAGEVDIARATLYRHFPVKEAIVNDYAQILNKAHEARIKGAWTELPDTCSRLTAVLFEHWEVVQAEFTMDILRVFYSYRMQTLFQSFVDQSFVSGFSGLLADIIRLGQETGELKRNVPAETVANLLDWTHTNAVMRWVADPVGFPIRERINLSVDLFLNGVKNRER